ncbi:MAG: FtsX-like permease family protein, partial [Gemmatimonadetes bacterium]|nr:FtsX-like permease family protein [Gemmatimonadota bacterium]
GETTEIIGIMPPGFRFPFLEDVWLTHRIDRPGLVRGAGTDLDVFGRLREGVSLDAARDELSAIATRLAAAFPESNQGIGMIASPYEERFMPREIQAILWVMLAATFGVLLIACANVANLLMARASIRSKEVAIRTALGASRWRVVRQLLLEALLLVAVGGAVGLAIAYVGLQPYRAAVAGIYKPYWIDFRMDPPVLLFSLLVTGAAALAAGVFPAVRASGIQTGEVLKDEGRGSSSLRLGRLSRFLVISEIAVSCALLVGAGFMIRSVMNLKNVDLGFETERVIAGRVGLFDTDYPDPEMRDQFFTLLKERAEQEPGVELAAVGSSLPGLGGPRYFLSVEGEEYPTDRDHPVVLATTISADYFDVFGVTVIEGRDFDATETRLGGDPVAVVNQSFAESYLGGSRALGRRIRLGLSDSTRPWRNVVGVVPDMHVGGNVGGIGDDQERPERIFLPQGALDHSFMSLAIRTQGPPGGMAPAIRALVAELDPNLPVYELMPMNEAIEESTWAFGLFGSLFTIFGAAALFLACVGLYGVMAFSVAQRRLEMGIRMAMGAEAKSIVRLVVGRGGRQLALGITAGVLLGVVMSRSMRVILYGVEMEDPLVYLVIILTLSASGLLASFLPAMAATRADPVEALRKG